VGHRKPGAFGREHLRLAGLVAEHAAAVIENARLYRRAQGNVRELKRLNDLKTEFLSMVSHDLLSPLSSVEGFLSLMLKEEVGPLTGQQKEFLTLCAGSLQRVTMLIDDLLDLSRIEAGAVKIRPELVDLRDLLALARREHEPSAREKGLTLALSVPDGLPLVNADPHRLRQVVDNLLRNALKFTPEGGRVLLSARRRGDEVIVSVKDTGIGLSETEREKVFERYYQVEESASRRARGAGLGLAICKSLVEHHGGRIWVDSVPGRGSDFQFSLPVKA
jgi:signal transduction histidine kinase